MPNHSHAKKTVVIIGGGAAGHQIAYQLRDVARVILVDPKTYWEVPMALPRLLADPKSLPARIPYADFLDATQHIQGRVTELSDTTAKVTRNDGLVKVINFHHAVIATGSASLDPLIKAQASTEAERAAEIQIFHNKLQQARSVVIVGAGPVGVETAAELREKFPDLNVAVVHSKQQILNNAPDKFAGWAVTYLRDKGVRLVLGESVTSPAPGEQPADAKVVTSSGKTLPADTVIWAAGTRPVTGLVADSWPDVMQPDGLIRVDQYLRVVGHPAIFAVGDITNLPENRLAIVAGLHVKSVVANLKRLIDAPALSQVSLKPYKPAVPGKGMGKLMIVSLGRLDGLSSLPFGQFRASFFARKIKSHDMLVGMSRKAVGLK
ncbi:FAD-dependent oxidoreductase [Dickeya dianthicola]|uniref:NAD(P)/FAD-dependent oxidoreductase n=1 Tax=Dickeya dianthicola TaxID=204039 RepID=UPI001F620C52|nr:FAD-dependent oxidoreductase [Dickeya dianthicola]MCI4184662.1 FAD-dependent oxidoreductase [Dickeya dianthicola]